MTEKSTPVQDTSFWLLKLQQNLSLRRGTMYRFLASSLQLLILGNAGGIGFILSLFPSNAEPPGVHWLCVSAILAFLFGTLAAAATIIFSNALAMKEANAAEAALIELMNEKMTVDEAVVYLDDTTFPIATSAMISGMISIFFLIVGALFGVVIMVLYY